MFENEPNNAPMNESDEYSSDMLFTDGLPNVDSRTGYRGTAAASAVGISYRQLDYWDRTGLVLSLIHI